MRTETITVRRKQFVVRVFNYREPHEVEDRATATILIDEQGLAYIGVSICAVEDQFVKHVGNVKSRGEAVSALYHRQAAFRIFGPTAAGLRSFIVDEIARIKYDIARRKARRKNKSR